MLTRKFFILWIAVCSCSGAVLAQQDVSVVSSDVSKVRVFPNPWRADANAGQNITIDHLPAGSTIKIFTVSGHWVRTLTPSSPPDTASWDLLNAKGDKVASGVYLYVVTASAAGGSAEKATGKIVIIK